MLVRLPVAAAELVSVWPLFTGSLSIFVVSAEKSVFAVFKTSFENALKKLKSDEDEINLEELLKAVQG